MAEKKDARSEAQGGEVTLLLCLALAAAPFPSLDDGLHFGVSSVGALSLYGGLQVCGWSKPAATWTALGAMAAVGVGYEALQHYAPAMQSDWSWRDLAANGAGLALSALIMWAAEGG
jgi:hypothetical protein